MKNLGLDKSDFLFLGIPPLNEDLFDLDAARDVPGSEDSSDLLFSGGDVQVRCLNIVRRADEVCVVVTINECYSVIIFSFPIVSLNEVK